MTGWWTRSRADGGSLALVRWSPMAGGMFETRGQGETQNAAGVRQPMGEAWLRGRGARTQYGAGGALTCACTAKNFQPVSTSAMPAQPVEASTAPNVTIPPRYWRGRTLDPAIRGLGET
jgi:hypothetical protein